ncbi:MAG: hypothetical protein JNK82_40695, partial [Myxococcaceae bacterium]|nr:hypothetical protein [Myxococcaceae bacterium]
MTPARTWLLAAVVALTACPGPSGTDGGAGGGGGGDSGYTYVIIDGGWAGLAVPAGTDAALLTLAALGDLDDAGRRGVLSLGPDGTTFAPSAYVSMRLTLDAGQDPDAGEVAVPIWLLESADGGLEPMRSTTTVITDRGVPRLAVATATVPHFSSVKAWELLSAFVDPGDDYVHPLKAPFFVIAGVNTHGLRTHFSGTAELRYSPGTLEPDEVAPLTQTVTLGSSAVVAIHLRCTTPGLSWVTTDVELTQYEHDGDVRPVSQRLQVRRNLLCVAPAPPGEPPQPASGVHLKPEQTDLRPGEALEAAALARLISSGVPDAVVNGLRLTLVSPCGRGNGPCEVGPQYTASLIVENATSTPVATDSVALHHQKTLAPEQHELLTMRS